MTAFVTVSTFVAGGLFAYSGAFPDNAVNEGGVVAGVQAIHVLPQGWSFFTRNPREDVVTIWRGNSEGDVVPLVQTRNVSAANSWGAGRSSRVEGLLAGRLVTGATAADLTFEDCPAPTGDGPAGIRACLAGLSLPEVTIDGSWEGLCGPVYLVARPPQPWAWFAAGVDDALPAKAMGMEVRC